MLPQAAAGANVSVSWMSDGLPSATDPDKRRITQSSKSTVLT
jgi:hypothetical protein